MKISEQGLSIFNIRAVMTRESEGGDSRAAKRRRQWTSRCKSEWGGVTPHLLVPWHESKHTVIMNSIHHQSPLYLHAFFYLTILLINQTRRALHGCGGPAAYPLGFLVLRVESAERVILKEPSQTAL